VRLVSGRAHCNRAGVRLVLEDEEEEEEEGEEEKEEPIKSSLLDARRISGVCADPTG
jgi:hypothetical protein